MRFDGPAAKAGAIFGAVVIVSEFLLLIGSLYLFRCTNTDEFFRCLDPTTRGPVPVNIPPDILSGLLGGTDSPNGRGEAVHARLTWVTTVVLVVAFSVAATILAILKILKEKSFARWPAMAGLVAVIFVSALLAMKSDVSRELLQDAVLVPTIGSYAVGGIRIETFAVIRQIANALVTGATVAVVFALVVRSAVGPALATGNGSALSGRERLADLHDLLIAGAAVLASVILTMVAWLNWPTAGLAEDSPARILIVEIAMGVGLYWGTVFSLVLVFAYLPCRIYLIRLIAAVDAGEAPQEEIAQQPLRFLQDVIALISPFSAALLPVFLV